MPLAPSASAREPASIQRPTVEVWAPGMVSVEIERPFESTLVLVTGPWAAGVASARASVCGTVSNHIRGGVGRLRRLRVSVESIFVELQHPVAGCEPMRCGLLPRSVKMRHGQIRDNFTTQTA